jgi:hypothetical protein
MLRPLLIALMLGCASGAQAQSSPAPAPAPAEASPAPDYAKPESWACRPGAEDDCVHGLDAVAIAADGKRTPTPFVAAADPKIDCFYVYPTVSREPTPYSDLAHSAEVIYAVRAQAGRLAARCRLFAPMYRQATLAHLHDVMAGNKPIESDMPYRDVEAAWAWYLAHDNHGRGVVLVGHSQGTILLQRLIAEHIDGQPVQAQLVSAFLAGDPALLVPAGKAVGGTFKHIPTCAAAAQTGCVYVWGSYLANDTAPARVFGHNSAAGQLAACASPAAPGGGKALLTSYMPKPSFAPASDPPYIALIDQLSGECAADAQGNVLRVTVEPTPFGAMLTPVLARLGDPGWGLHVADISLVQGNMLDVIGAESAAWARHRP